MLILSQAHRQICWLRFAVEDNNVWVDGSRSTPHMFNCVVSFSTKQRVPVCLIFRLGDLT